MLGCVPLGAVALFVAAASVSGSTFFSGEGGDGIDEFYIAYQEWV